MDSTTYVIFVVVTIVLMCWVTVHFLARQAPSHDPMKSSHTRQFFQALQCLMRFIDLTGLRKG